MFRLRGELEIGDQEIRARTGRDWREWFAVLDTWGTDRGAHRNLSGYLRRAHGLSTWWAQTVTIRYSQEKNDGGL